MLAIAFAAEKTLAEASNLDGLTLAEVQEAVRPRAGAQRTIRELEGLGIRLALAGDAPLPILRRVAQALWLDALVVASPDPIGAVVAEIGLPAACIWFVTAAETQARDARERGLNVVLIDAARPLAIDEPDEGGLYVGAAIEDLLEIIRVPYTRSALNLRYLLRKIMDAPSVDELVR